MNRTESYHCPTCSAHYTIRLHDASLLVCPKCGTIIATTVPTSGKDVAVMPPPDWSFLQIGTTGEFQDQPFTIVGRCRLQLRNDYKNFWTAEYGQGKCLWIAESFASFSIFTSVWEDYTKDVSKLRAGSTFVVDSKNEKFTGEYVEKCDRLSYEGELGPWSLFSNGFFVVQASRGNDTALFFIEAKKKVNYLRGTKVNFENLKLKNIIAWDEWK